MSATVHRGVARRWFAVLAALVLAVGALTAPAAAPAGAALAPTVVGDSLVGVRAAPKAGQSNRQAVESLESSLGRRASVISEYPAWNSTFPTSYHKWLRDSGHRVVLMLKLKRKDGSRPKWRDLANAKPGDALYVDLMRWAKAFNSYGAPLYVAFHKEPNEPANKKNGTAVDYKAAWARIVTFMADNGVTNVEWVFAMSGRAYAKSVNTWYPGDPYVDIIASTGISGCSGGKCAHRQQTQIMAPMVKWSQSHPSKRIAVCESGAVESTTDPLAKSKWLNNAQADLKGSAYQRLEFVVYWSSGNFRLDTSKASLKAARAWYADPYWTS